MKSLTGNNSGQQGAEHGITIWLDTYDDIFSDFDPREFNHRALSDDFLQELKKIAREDDEHQELQEIHLLIPTTVRNKQSEEIISQRLHQYFRKNHQRLREELNKARITALLLILSGLAFLLLAGFISFLHPQSVVLHLVMVTLEPAGWFFAWMGYDNLVNTLPKKKSDLEFQQRMSRNKIVFRALQTGL